MLEQMLCMELPFAGHSSLHGEAQIFAGLVVFRPGDYLDEGEG